MYICNIRGGPSKGTNLEIFEHVYNIMHIVRGGHIVQSKGTGVVQSKGTNLEIFEHVYKHNVHIVQDI